MLQWAIIFLLSQQCESFLCLLETFAVKVQG
jgi:hypothetical protein